MMDSEETKDLLNNAAVGTVEIATALHTIRSQMQGVHLGEPFRALALAITKLDEARMWIAEADKLS